MVNEKLTFLEKCLPRAHGYSILPSGFPLKLKCHLFKNSYPYSSDPLSPNSRFRRAGFLPPDSLHVRVGLHLTNLLVMLTLAFFSLSALIRITFPRYHFNEKRPICTGHNLRPRAHSFALPGVFLLELCFFAPFVELC